MHVRIVSIETAGPDRRARRLVFSEGEPRATAAAVVRALGLSEGDEFDEDDLAASLEEYESACARERALRVLSYRERSLRELDRRLRDDGYPAGVSREIVDLMAELGLVDDERFAHTWARSRAASGFGRERVSRELKDKGVPAAVIDAALSDAFEAEDEVSRARRLIEGRPSTTRAERERLVARLVRRGFAFGVAIRAVSGGGDEADDS